MEHTAASHSTSHLKEPGRTIPQGVRETVARLRSELRGRFLRLVSLSRLGYSGL